MESPIQLKSNSCENVINDCNAYQCLTNQIMIQFKFYDSIHVLSNSYNSNGIRFKISSFNINKSDSNSVKNSDIFIKDRNDSNLIEISVMNENDCKFAEQEPNGRLYNPKEFILFRTKLFDKQIDQKAFIVDLYSCKTSTDCERIAFCYIFASHLKDTNGFCSVPFTGSDEQLIAQLNVEYLIITPFKGNQELYKTLSSNSWKLKSNGYDIGHRGAGIARRTDRSENILENTIASFNFASLHGADMVELDVQLSKDKIAFVYHDYNVNILMKSKNSTQESEFYQMAVKELTHKQLNDLQLSPVIKANKSKYDFGDDEKEDNKPFASLQKVLESVNPKCGLNVEIKYPQQQISGSWEADITFELNEYVDIILETLFAFSGNRNIFISTFHPDICSMLRLKQNVYPVIFITQGLTKKWQQFKDRRNCSIEMATYFALSMELHGINVHAEDIINDRTLIQFVKSKNLILFCWGEDLNRRELISQLKKEGVDGVIYDKIDVLSEKADVVNTSEAST